MGVAPAGTCTCSAPLEKKEPGPEGSCGCCCCCFPELLLLLPLLALLLLLAVVASEGDEAGVSSEGEDAAAPAGMVPSAMRAARKLRA